MGFNWHVVLPIILCGTGSMWAILSQLLLVSNLDIAVLPANSDLVNVRTKLQIKRRNHFFFGMSLVLVGIIVM